MHTGQPISVEFSAARGMRRSSAPFRLSMRCFLGGALFLLCAPSLVVTGQNTNQAPPHPILLPQANHLPDINDQMKMNSAQRKRQNFDATNALRQHQINDDATKLLILTRDLKAQMGKIGDNPLPDRLLREAEAIELLAHDVQAKMTLSVSGS